jgi:hypothetical protein
MATRTTAAKKPQSAPRARPAAKAKRVTHEPDVIRIVPLRTVDERPTAEATAAGPAAAPNLTYRNGPLIANVEVFTIFWGAAWNGPQSALLTTVNQFFDFVLSSALIDQLSEYSVPNYKIGHGKRTGTITITSPAPKHSESDAAIQAFLQAQIANNAAVPKPGPNTLYFIYAPPGVRIVQGGSASCQAFCGYHNDIGGSIFYAVMPFPGCAGCRGSLSAGDALTSTSSHELCEAITDAVPGQGWYDDANGEIGDICAWKTKTLGNFCVQLEWSNKAGQCV